jgi:ribosomal protein L37E
MMLMLLQYLRFTLGGGHEIKRGPAMWSGRCERPAMHTRDQRISCGLGFGNTLQRRKYCWLEQVIDWNRLRFHPEVTDYVLFGKGAIQGQYIRRGGQVRDFFSAFRHMELALEWIDKYRKNTQIQHRLLS